MKRVFTIGSGTRTLEEFVEALVRHGVERVVDVRRFPASKRFPHFKKESLENSLPRSGMEYHYLGSHLGGFRKEGYGEHMKTGEFRKGIEALETLASEKNTAFFCSETLFFRCHRRFIAEYLTKRGWRVVHIIDGKRSVNRGAAITPSFRRTLV